MISDMCSIDYCFNRTTVHVFANTVDQDEMAHNQPPHLNLQCLPSCLRIFCIIQLEFKRMFHFADLIFPTDFLGL